MWLIINVKQIKKGEKLIEYVINKQDTKTRKECMQIKYISNRCK